MLKHGGIRPFFLGRLSIHIWLCNCSRYAYLSFFVCARVGSVATISRDVVFGGVFSTIRNAKSQQEKISFMSNITAGCM